MKDNKTKYYNNVSIGLYVLAMLIIIIPTFIVFISGQGLSAFFSKIVISAAVLCIEIGLLIRTFIKQKQGKSIAKNIGAMVGLLLVMISRILK